MQSNLLNARRCSLFVVSGVMLVGLVACDAISSVSGSEPDAQATFDRAEEATPAADKEYATVEWTWANRDLEGWNFSYPKPTILWPEAGGIDVQSGTESEYPDLFIRSPALSLVGSEFDKVLVDLECVENCVTDPTKLDLSLFPTTEAHQPDPNFRDKPQNNTPLDAGERKTLVYDVTTLSAGGADWVDSTILGIRFDFPQGAAARYVLHSIRICEIGDPACN